MKMVFAFALGLFVALGAHAQASQPAATAEWHLTGSRSYEQSSPGLGTSQRFESSCGWMDVYSYDLRRTDWRDDTSDPQFAAHFAEVLRDVRAMGARGIVSDLSIGPERDVEVDGQTFRAASFTFVFKGRPSDSAVYLTARNGRLLKYRITCTADPARPAAAMLEDFIPPHMRVRAP